MDLRDVVVTITFDPLNSTETLRAEHLPSKIAVIEHTHPVTTKDDIDSILDSLRVELRRNR